jgi:ubiquinone/menaquinone biosynthesis C-methylase UbiE
MISRKNIYRSKLEKNIDFITFPVRALFLHEDGFIGLSSLRDERMRAVAQLCKGKILDIGCGPGNIFINEFIGPEFGIGIDIYPYKGVNYLVEDMANLPFEDNYFDNITLIAVGGHIPKSKRDAEFKEFARVLKYKGRLVMTEGEPITQWILHKWVKLYFSLLGKKDMDSEREMEEEEQFCMPKEEIYKYLNQPPLKYIQRKPFMWGLNNIYIAEKAL